MTDDVSPLNEKQHTHTHTALRARTPFLAKQRELLSSFAEGSLKPVLMRDRLEPKEQERVRSLQQRATDQFLGKCMKHSDMQQPPH